MTIIKQKDWTLTFSAKPKGETFFWRPNFCSVKGSFHKIEDGPGFSYINTFSHYITTQIWVTWLFWTLRLYIKPEPLQSTPCIYMEYKKEDLHLFQLTHGSRKDPTKYEQKPKSD